MVRPRMVPEFDPRTFPIEPILRQAVGPEVGRASDAWNLLGTMARNERPEAGIFLLGLMRVHEGDLTRMAVPRPPGLVVSIRGTG